MFELARNTALLAGVKAQRDNWTMSSDPIEKTPVSMARRSSRETADARPTELGIAPEQGPRSAPQWIQKMLADDDSARPVPRPMLSPGELIPGTRYRLERWLGDGGMGVVYEAEQVDLERLVAVKILRPDVCTTPAVLEQFRKEAKAASRIGSQYIVQIFDFAELTDGRLLFAMERLVGTSLLTEIRSRGTLTVERTVGILRQMCKGLAAAHDEGIVHRDVKPENTYLVEHEGRPDAVKLLDFGIATVIDRGSAIAKTVAGTPDYLAPEIISGMSYDHRADIYSLGCTAYQLLTGRPPFEAPELTELLVAHLKEDPAPPSSVRADGKIPAALDAVVLKCLAKSPADRYQDMRDLEAALCEAQIDARFHTTWDDLPLPDVDPDRRAQLVTGMPDLVAAARPRRKGWVIGVAVAVLLGAGGVTGYVLRPAEQPVDAQDDQIERLMNLARAAAAQNYYVYPPPDRPDAPTAFVHVATLEQIEGNLRPIARDAARILRSEFAATLVRSGDEFWEQEEGKVFALDFYAQALVFDPEREPARTRAAMSPGELALLRQKAEMGDFSEAELIAVEPLAVLAEADDVERNRKLSNWKKRRAKKPAAKADPEASVESLLAKSGKVFRPTESAPAPPPTPEPDPDPELEEDGELVLDEEVAAEVPSEGAPEEIKKSKRDPGQAKALAKRGTQSLSAGNAVQAEGLFNQALGYDRRNATALMGLSDIYFNRGSYPKAVSYAERAVKSSPRRAAYRVKLGDAYFKVLRYRDARSAYRKAKDLGSKDADWRLDKVQKKLGG